MSEINHEIRENKQAQSDMIKRQVVRFFSGC